MSREEYQPDVNQTPLAWYEQKARRGLEKARRALAATGHDHTTIEPDPGEEPCSNPE